MAGCGSSANTTLTKQWQTEVGEEARTVAVEPTRGHLLVGMRKETTVFDASGTKIRGDEEGGLSGLVNQVKEAAN